MEEENVDEQSSSDSESDDDSEIQEAMLKLQACRDQVRRNELDYEAHLGLINSLQILGEFQELRKAREHMNQIYPLSPDIWLQWLLDEQKICTEEEERKYITDLFEKAVHEYASVKVWVEYIMFMLGGGNMDDSRNVCEKALTAVGIHFAEGILIWQAVILVEQQFLVNLQSESDEKKIEESKKRILNLYRRQARVPLMNTDKDTFMNDAAKWCEGGQLEPHIKADLDKHYEKMLTKVPFEEALLHAQDETVKLEAYRKYIDHVRNVDNPAVIQSLYERTLTDLCLNAGLWEEYVKFMIDQFPSGDYVVLPVCERSQMNCPWSGVLCDLHISSLEKFSNIIGEKKADEKIKASLQKTLTSGVSVGAELVKSWMAYLVYLRRKILWKEKHEDQLNDFREACEQAIEFIDQRCGEDGDIDCEIARFQARVEAELASNMEGARKIWNDHILKRNKNSKNYNFWLEFINLERSFGSENYCRKLFRRALERIWDWVEVIGKSFLQFERELGTLETMSDFENRYRDRLSVVQKKRLEDAAKEELAMKQEKNKLAERKQKLQPSFSGSEKSKTVSDREFKKPYPVTEKSPIKSNKRDTQHITPSGSKRQAEDISGTDPKRPKVEETHGEFVKHDPSLDYKTVFLSNMDYHAENKDILPVFAECGEIYSLRITRDYQGRSKGFGYLVFKFPESVQKALKLDRTPVGGRPLFVSLCNPKEREQPFKFSASLEREKLFVRGLPYSMNEQEIKEAFEPHGKVKAIRLITYRNGHSKGTCYIEYHDADTAENVRKKMDGAILKDFKISVFISNPSAPRGENKKQSSSNSSTSLSNPVPGPSRGGSQRQKLAFVPRSLLRKSATQEKSQIHESVNGSTMDGLSQSDGEAQKSKSNEDFRKMFTK